MKWSLKIAQFRGIPIYIHTTFLILIFWIVLAYWIHSTNKNVMFTGILFVLIFFFSVVLHEIGHTLLAKNFKIKIRDITLLPIGGVVRLDRVSDDPKQELWRAISGPLVNLIIAITILFFIKPMNLFESILTFPIIYGSFWELLFLINVFLVCINLIPAFPMDGGRILRAILISRKGYGRATHISATIGQGLAFIFGFIGLFFFPFLIFIAFFVWIGATQEANMVKIRTVFDGIPVRNANIKNIQTLNSEDTLGNAVEMILAGSQQDFPVTKDGRVIGVLERKNLMTALAESGQTLPVDRAMTKDFKFVKDVDMLQNAMVVIQNCQSNSLPVLNSKGELSGLLTMENIGELMMIQATLNRKS